MEESKTKYIVPKILVYEFRKVKELAYKKRIGEWQSFELDIYQKIIVKRGYTYPRLTVI